MLAVDIYYSLNSSNTVYISGSGTGQFQAPTLVTAPTGTIVEFATVDGMKSNIGFEGIISVGNGFTIEPSGTELVFPFLNTIHESTKNAFR